VIETDHTEVDFAGDELAGGELLAERLAQGPLAPEEALRYAIEIGAALKRAHSKGMVHGGLSPYSVRIASTGARLLQPLRESDERAAPIARRSRCGARRRTGAATCSLWRAAVRNGQREAGVSGYGRGTERSHTRAVAGVTEGEIANPCRHGRGDCRMSRERSIPPPPAHTERRD